MIPLNAPSLGSKEREYVLDALESGWVTSGAWVDRFEAQFALLAGRRFAVASSSGTTALWLALRALNLTGRVVVGSYACDAVAHAVTLATGLPPIIVDVEPETWAMDIGALRAVATDDRVDAVILVHTYGVPARDTLEIAAFCHARGLTLVEDGSESHGAAIDSRPVGSFGDLSIFSCRGEKLVSGGQLGVVCSDDDAFMRRVRQHAHCGLPSDRVRYWSTVPALNCQPANMHAALACAQLERFAGLRAARVTRHAGWRSVFGALIAEGRVRFQREYGSPSWWLTGVHVGGLTALDPRDLGTALEARGCSWRPGFYPLEQLPPYRGLTVPCPVSTDLFRHLIVLPSGDGVGPAEQETVYDAMMEIVGGA